MNPSRLALVLGVALPIAAGCAYLTACSSSSTPSTAGDRDSGGARDSTMSSSGGEGGHVDAGGGGDGGTGGHEAGFECGATPVLQRNDAGTVLCVNAEAGALDCRTGEECCLGGSVAGGQLAPAGCAAFGTPCTNGSGDGGNNTQAPIPIECAQISDCRANGLVAATACCLKGATKDPVACAFPVYSGGTAILCEGDAGGVEAGACALGEAQICSSQADCPPGKTCVAGVWKLLQPGFCL